jgi:tetratricopeptide (TPR) repeat protein
MGSNRTLLLAAPVALAVCAFVLWPAYVERASDAARAAALPTMAPVVADYRRRDATIAFWEGMVAKHNPEDMISPRQVAEQYLQRYRERGDIDDVLRAENDAKLSLRAQPRGNIAAELELASIFLTLHRFHDAIVMTRDVMRYDPGDPQMFTREATLDLEVGAYALARERLDAVPSKDRNDGWRVVESRYLELTGRLAQARDLLATASAGQNAAFDNPAQQRAWYFFREGEMAFEAGDNDAAIADENEALTVFPNYSEANRFKARFECALHRWKDCLRDATASANVVPYPETLGYVADAQRALGDGADAARTDDLIRAIERIGNAQHISDRLLAIYYSEHRIHVDDAYRIAKRELLARDDILTEDTLAWAAAMDGRWDEARAHMKSAIRFDTENSLLQYHAGAIALHFGDKDEAKARFERALALNPSFHPFYADDARAQLARL